MPFSFTQTSLAAAATEILTYMPGSDYTVDVSYIPTATVTSTDGTLTTSFTLYSLSTIGAFTPTQVVADGVLTAYVGGLENLCRWSLC